MELLFKLFFVFTIIILESIYLIEGQSASRKKMIEEMGHSMKELETAFAKLSAQLQSTETNFNLFQDKVTVILNTVELTKVRTRMIEEKFSSLETKLISIEETVKTNLQHLVNGSSGGTESIINVHSHRLETAEKGFVKMMNVLTDLYGLVKENHSKDRAKSGGYNESLQDNMRKIVREEVNILKHELVTDMNITGLNGRLGEVFSMITNIQENSFENKPKFGDDVSTGNHLQNNQQTTEEMCSDFSRLRNQFSFAIQEIRDNMTLLIDSMKITPGQKGIKNQPNSGTTLIPVTINSQQNQADSPREDKMTYRTADCPIIDPRSSSKHDCSHSRPSFPKDCSEIIQSNSSCQSKVYAVRTGSPLRVQRVYCDMSDNRGGWTVIMRRGKFSEKKHHVDFRTNWETYKRGFGDISDEFWIGNQIIHHLTAKEPQILQIDLKSFADECISLQFKRFAIADESNRYRLIIDEPFGENKETGEIFLSFNNTEFITNDMIKDSSKFLCSNLLTGGWWANQSRCPLVYLNGLYKEVDVRKEVDTGIRWMTFKENESLKEVQMKIRPVSFLNEV